MFASLHTSTLTVARVQSRSPLVGFVAKLRRGIALRAGRKQLIGLDDSRLNDIGMTRAEALAEAARPIWDVPGSWRA